LLYTVAADKSVFKIAHLRAVICSVDRTTLEEINRIVAASTTDYLF
jgi:hypothetical protein